MTALPAPMLQRPAPRRVPAWFGGSMPVARFGVILNLFVPGLVLLWDAWHHMLGVNAVNFAIKTTGLIAVTYLMLSLVVTPLKSITGFTWLVQFRRAIGCYAFYFAAAHLSIYFWWDRGRSVSSTFEEITHHYYLLIGFISLSLMLPLWMTSFNAAIQWMGGKKWKLLHRLAYVSAALGCWHYYLQAKADKSRPDIYIGVLGALLLWRAVAGAVTFVRRPSNAKASTASAGKLRHWSGDLKVVAMFRETDVVRTFRFAMVDGSPIPFTYQAGQFLTLTVPIDGKKVLRSYTIASTPTRDAYIELTIKREEHGHVSQYLHDMLMTGQSVNISGPAGRFTFDPKSAEGVTLIAGGVGITPSMSIVRDLTDRGWPGNIDLVFVVRSPGDVIFADELKLLTSRHPNLHVHYSVTRDIPDDWMGIRGHLKAEHLRDRIPDLTTRPAYICGPTAMADSAKAQLIAAGVPAGRIKVESFTPAASIAKDVGMNPADEMNGTLSAMITFEQSGKTAQMSANQTVLEVAEMNGVTIDFQCRSGVCGTCRCKLLSGQVTMAVRDALSDADEADGFILACQARALVDVAVDA